MKRLKLTLAGVSCSVISVRSLVMLGRSTVFWCAIGALVFGCGGDESSSNPIAPSSEPTAGPGGPTATPTTSAPATMLAIGAAAVLLLVTGIVGWCPLYSLLKFRTNKA